MPKALNVVFAREKTGFETVISDLTPNQIAVLRGLANTDTSQVFSSMFMEKARMASPGSVRRAINSLLVARLIFKRKGEYKFFNPFFREWLKSNF